MQEQEIPSTGMTIKSDDPIVAKLSEIKPPGFYKLRAKLNRMFIEQKFNKVQGVFDALYTHIARIQDETPRDRETKTRLRQNYQEPQTVNDCTPEVLDFMRFLDLDPEKLDKVTITIEVGKPLMYDVHGYSFYASANWQA